MYCQDTRSLSQNRKLAEKRLAEKVEYHLKGDESKIGKAIIKRQKAKRKSAARSKAKHSKSTAVEDDGVGGDSASGSESETDT